MKPATAPRAPGDVRVLVVGEDGGVRGTRPAAELPSLLRSGDLVVVNDAATLPASLQARTRSGEALELRLVGALPSEDDRVRYHAALLGAGDYHTPTELRPLPPRVALGESLTVGDELVARVASVSAISPRLVELEFTADDAHGAAGTWAALYRAGRPVQYAHVPAALALWDVQNTWASRPWAVEMPSAGRALRTETLLELRSRGVEVAFVTHAAGLSATGDPAIDARLPLPERFEVGEHAVRAVDRTKARGGRVLAIGTSVVRALESAAHGGHLRAASGVTNLLIGPATKRLVVDGILTGVHESDTTHFTLLGAFAQRATLVAALAAAERDGLLGHELGDAWLVWGAPLARAPATYVVAPHEASALLASASCGASATVAA